MTLLNPPPPHQPLLVSAHPQEFSTVCECEFVVRGRITFGKSFKRINKKAKIVNRNGNYTGLSVFFFFFFPSITAERLVLLCICFWGNGLSWLLGVGRGV